MEYSKESRDRQEKIQNMKDAGIICYANNYHGKQDISKVRTYESSIKDVNDVMENGAVGEFKTAGRLMSSRGMGKLTFGKIRDHSGDIQICFSRDKVIFNTGKEKVESLIIAGEEKSAYKIAEKFVQVGDYVGVEGDLFLTKHGELTLFVREFQVLSKAVRPLPEKFHGVTDQETIYRQRYLDMIMNDESYNRFRLRSKFVKALRDFYHNNEFVEIETPVLGNAASGAAAAPFITHHNDFDEDFFLRISPETALKKATVGRFERVVEFTRNFRNEGSDPSHMQEFSAIEHYGCWWNFEDNMKFTEDMFDFIFSQIPELQKEVEMKDKQGNARLVNFQTPWQRIDYVEGVKDACGIDVSKYFVGDEKKLIADIKAAGVQFERMDTMGVPTLIDYLYKKVLRPSIVGPAFVYNYPKTMQPLARQSDQNPDIVEQFQVVVNGWEIIKAYSELVDPKVQAQNFDDQSAAIERGDEEATSGDDDFVLAMEYGMPCQSGWGMGIERVFSLLTGQENLRDVVLFPLMKSEKTEKQPQLSKETKLAVAIVNINACEEKWQEMNTVAHLNAAFAARQGKGLFMQDCIETQDGAQIKLNIQHAIMIKKTSNQNELIDLIMTANESGLEVSEFTKEMLETTDDKKVSMKTKDKNYNEIVHMGVLIFGGKKIVENLTKDFELYS